MFVAISDMPYERAMEKAKEPNMLLKDNPLAPAEPGMGGCRAHKNMLRLEKDAKMRSCPHNGVVYAGIMDTRFGG